MARAPAPPRPPAKPAPGGDAGLAEWRASQVRPTIEATDPHSLPLERIIAELRRLYQHAASGVAVSPGELAKVISDLESV